MSGEKLSCTNNSSPSGNYSDAEINKMADLIADRLINNKIS